MRAKSSIDATLLVLVTTSVLSAQQLTVTNPFAVPGGIVNATFNNTGPQTVYIFGSFLALVHPSGEIATPDFPNYSDAGFAFGPGSSFAFSYQAPASGPGSSGTFILYTPLGSGAGARIDVGAPTSVQSIISFNKSLFSAFGGHGISTSATWPSEWQILNVGAAPHTFSGGDAITIRAVGSASPTTTLGLAGLVVAPNQGLGIPMPANLPAGQYVVETTWTDPVLGPLTTRQGAWTQRGVDLHLPLGHIVPLGSSLPVRIQDQNVVPSTTVTYALLVGLTPGTLALPGGGSFPLLVDTVLQLSLANGLSGLVANHVGPFPTVLQGTGLLPTPRLQTTAVSIAHPNVPAALGFTVWIAALAYDPVTGRLDGSNLERIRLQ